MGAHRLEVMHLETFPGPTFLTLKTVASFGLQAKRSPPLCPRHGI